jgi:hypothetical protein
MSTSLKTVVEYNPGSVLAEGTPQAIVFGRSMVRFKREGSKDGPMTLDIRGLDPPQLLKKLRAFEEVVRDTIIHLEG